MQNPFSPIDEIAIQKAVRLLQDGKVVAIPTETVYGLAADAKNAEAISQIYTLKGRPSSNPLIIHLNDIAAIQDWAIDIPEVAYQLAERFWPGPLTLILRKHSKVLPLVTGGQDTVALRIPNHPVTLALLKTFGSGLAAPSANRSGSISPTCTKDVRAEFGDTVECILEGGPCHIGIESTIVSLVDNRIQILRPGHIDEIALQTVTKKKIDNTAVGHIITPGSSPLHYAPHTALYLLEKTALEEEMMTRLAAKQHVAILHYSLLSHTHSAMIRQIKLNPDPIAYAQQLYASLRALDDAGCDCILVEMPPQTLAWLAIHDRLRRAQHSI